MSCRYSTAAAPHLVSGAGQGRHPQPALIQWHIPPTKVLFHQLNGECVALKPYTYKQQGGVCVLGGGGGGGGRRSTVCGM